MAADIPPQRSVPNTGQNHAAVEDTAVRLIKGDGSNQ